jgi:hypothetical protein
LGVRQLFELHTLFETTGTFPEETFPRGESGCLEQSVLKDCLNTTKSLDDIGSVSIQVPQLTVVTLGCPPEGVALHLLVNLELCASSETLIETERASILLEEGVDTWETTVPTVLKILKGETTVLLLSFETLLRVLGPDTLRVDKLSLPRDDVSENVGNQSLFVVRHTSTVVGDTSICLL